MKVHLVDGTYELFRHYYALPKQRNAYGEEIAAARGVLVSLLSLIAEGATHIAVATDHIIESFRNELWPDYKTGAGIEPDLFSQFELLEEALSAVGFLVWAMVEYEADDALAAGAALCSADPRVEQVIICTPDKDLAQCVSGNHVVQFDRRRRRMLNAAAVFEKYGVRPQSIPDYLALVGDAADGYPGISGWGAKSAAAVLAKYERLESIPRNYRQWYVDVRSAGSLCDSFFRNQELVFLFRQLATLIRKGPVDCSVDDLEWTGPTEEFARISSRLEAPDIHHKVTKPTISRIQKLHEIL